MSVAGPRTVSLKQVEDNSGDRGPRWLSLIVGAAKPKILKRNTSRTPELVLESSRRCIARASRLTSTEKRAIRFVIR